MPRNDHELLKCFDEDGMEIAPLPRTEVHRKPCNIWHGVTSIWILDIDGKMLCSKRGDFVESNPGKWQAYAGGHLLAHHSFEENAATELVEELGLTIPLEYILQEKTLETRHLKGVFAAVWNGDLSELNFEDKEVSEVRWLSFSEYEKEFEESPDLWKSEVDKELYWKVVERLGLGF